MIIFSSKGMIIIFINCISDCLEGCSNCRESWRGGSSICSSCASKELKPSGSDCLEQCRPGQFLEHKACKGEFI